MERNHKLEFYGGNFGPWISMILLVVGMTAAVLFNYTDFWVYNLLMLAAVVICFFLVKQKKQFGDVAVRGLQDSMLSILIIAFILASILSKLLRGSGLVDALVWLSGEMNLDAGFIPVVAFLVCALISTSCGTSSGSIVAVLPIMLPIGIELGCDASLLTGAVISGALFGDNLAPISDTTIASSLTQESLVSDVVKSRLPYSLIAGGISAVLFVIFGKITTGDALTSIDTMEADPKALVLLVVPVLMIVMMRIGWDLGGTLIVCDLSAMLISLALGLIRPAEMFSAEGPLVNGINGMLDIIVFCFFLFIVMQTIKESGALERLGNGLLKYCRSARSVELIIMISSALGTIVTAGSSTGILFAGPIANKISKQYHIAGTRSANILDATACATCGFIPICTPYLLSLSIGPEIEGIPDDYGYVSILKWVLHPIFLVILFLGSIITGIGRKYESREENEA
mgnify:CR=1 FL=1